MDSIEIRESLNWGKFEELFPYLDAVISHLDLRDEYPNFAQALESASEDAEINYRNYLGGKPIPGHGALKKPSGTVKSVTRRHVSGLIWAVGNDARAAEGIEEGTKEYDMKKRLQTAPTARVSKEGFRYIIIPFRHGTEATNRISALMTNEADPKRPKKIHNRAMDMATSMKQSHWLGSPRSRVSATGYTVPLYSYAWHGRLKAADLKAKGLSADEVKRYQGMVRMSSNGATKHSNYITFRVMSEKSKGWIRAAQPGFYPLQTAISVAFTSNSDALLSAFSDDMVAILQAELGL